MTNLALIGNRSAAARGIVFTDRTAQADVYAGPAPVPPPMPPPEPPPGPQSSPVNVEARSLNGSNGEIIGVTGIRIANAGDSSDAVEQTYAATDQVEMATLELSDAFPGGHYNIAVNWANGQKYRSDVPDFEGGNYVTVDAPNG